MTDREKVEAFMEASPEAIGPLAKLVETFADAYKYYHNGVHVTFRFRHKNGGLEVRHHETWVPNDKRG